MTMDLTITDPVAERRRQIALQAWCRIQNGAADPVAEIAIALNQAAAEAMHSQTLERVLALAIRLGEISSVEIIRELNMTRSLADSALLRLRSRGCLVRLRRGVYVPSGRLAT